MCSVSIYRMRAVHEAHVGGDDSSSLPSSLLLPSSFLLKVGARGVSKKSLSVSRVAHLCGERERRSGLRRPAHPSPDAPQHNSACNPRALLRASGRVSRPSRRRGRLRCPLAGAVRARVSHRHDMYRRDTAHGVIALRRSVYCRCTCRISCIPWILCSCSALAFASVFTRHTRRPLPFGLLDASNFARIINRSHRLKVKSETVLYAYTATTDY